MNKPNRKIWINRGASSTFTWMWFRFLSLGNKIILPANTLEWFLPHPFFPVSSFSTLRIIMDVCHLFKQKALFENLSFPAAAAKLCAQCVNFLPSMLREGRFFPNEKKKGNQWMRSQSLLIHTKHVKAATSFENNSKWMLEAGWNKLDTSWKHIISHHMAEHRH